MNMNLNQNMLGKNLYHSMICVPIKTVQWLLSKLVNVENQVHLFQLI